MAVYEHLYKDYQGEAQTFWSRFLVIPRYGLSDVFRSKLFTTAFILCFLYPLFAMILVYLHHNANAIALLQVDVRELLPIDASFFASYVKVQGAFALILTVLVAPPLISRDLANNALPLYLCRPLSRTEYVLGKMAVVVVLLSLVTWIPGLVIFSLQASLAGFTWFWNHLWVVWAMFSGSMIWIILLSLLALAVSALVRWRVVASGALLGLFFVPGAFGSIINEMFVTRSGQLISLWGTMNSIWLGLFGLFVRETTEIRDSRLGEITLLQPPLWVSWLLIALVVAVCVGLLARKVRAYEVIK